MIAEGIICAVKEVDVKMLPALMGTDRSSTRLPFGMQAHKEAARVPNLSDKRTVAGRAVR